LGYLKNLGILNSPTAISMKPFHELNYEIQKELFADTSDENPLTHSWFNTDTVDYWRHFRMFSPMLPLLTKSSKWLTVGDGRWGLDSIRLKNAEPSINILPTDLSPYLLEKSKEKKLIENFREENAEHLSFNDNQFDYTFCKESYHHFPRPFLAVYEMLRVSRKGIVLIEPRDQFPRPVVRLLIERLRSALFKLRGKSQPHPDCNHFEGIANYIYTISEREFEKMAIAIQLPLIAYYYFDDQYEEGVEYELVSQNGPLFKKLRRKLFIDNVKTKLGLRKTGHMACIIFKEVPGEDTLNQLKRNGFKFVTLPKNPNL
jgi:ubiquinone/menaquinone biosynthesis C-methylase UbiE